jgi:KDO2-lipid IV(A) lauroyltransferase
LSARYRKVALRNLRAAYSLEMTDREIKSIARRVFKHFTTAALEFFYLLSQTPERIDAMIDLQGREHIDSALERGNGCIILTAHYGNWELLARKSVLMGYKVNVIARDSDDPGMTGIATHIRETAGYRVFDRDQPIIGAFRCLKNNEILGILPDQNESGGVFVDFFSRPVATATGPAVLSLRSGAPIVPVFAPRSTDGGYKATAYPAIEFAPTGDWEKDILDLTALVTRAIEREVRANPSQWLWLHDRWKKTPEAEISAR